MKKASKVDYFAILHPLVLIILPAMAYLIWHMLKTILFTFLNLLIGKPIVKQDDSFLIALFYLCIAVFILYSVGFLAQLMLHICNSKESTLLPVWCMLTALILLVPTVEFLALDGHHMLIFFQLQPILLISFRKGQRLERATGPTLRYAMLYGLH